MNLQNTARATSTPFRKLPPLTRILLCAVLGALAIACSATAPVPTPDGSEQPPSSPVPAPDASKPTPSLAAAPDVSETPPASPSYYRAAGLPHLFGSCGHRAGLALGVISIEYTHSIIPGPDWRGGIAAQYSNSGRPTGRYGEPMNIQGDYDAMRVYGFDYYARGVPGDIVVLGKSGSSSADGCMVGVLTEDGLPGLASSASEAADTQTTAASAADILKSVVDALTADDCEADLILGPDAVWLYPDGYDGNPKATHTHVAEYPLTEQSINDAFAQRNAACH